MDFDSRILAARLKRLRTQLNMTQEQLAELVDLSAIYIRYMESGNRVPSLENMIRIRFHDLIQLVCFYSTPYHV